MDLWYCFYQITYRNSHTIDLSSLYLHRYTYENCIVLLHECRHLQWNQEYHLQALVIIHVSQESSCKVPSSRFSSNFMRWPTCWQTDLCFIQCYFWHFLEQCLVLWQPMHCPYFDPCSLFYSHLAHIYGSYLPLINKIFNLAVMGKLIFCNIYCFHFALLLVIVLQVVYVSLLLNSCLYW